MRFAKGHGTGNDFLILPDPEDAAALSPAFVASLCDRRTGLGADGILRVVRASGAGREPAEGGWFMDYRNADGSIAEMCGNGVRVFARYLIEHGLAEGPELAVVTRAGLRQVREEASGELTVDMGAPAVLGRSTAMIAGRPQVGLEVSLGNPHLACVVDSPVAAIDLSAPPVVDHGRFPDGANVEVIRVLADGHLEMRVYERGSGTTLSCGTGAVAAAVAAAVAVRTAAARPGNGQPGVVGATDLAGAADLIGTVGLTGAADLAGTWTVQVPGGTLTVTLTGATSLLTGPAVIVAEGELDPAWLEDLAVAAPDPA
jgi:diaminopimelate epimerase